MTSYRVIAFVIGTLSNIEGPSWSFRQSTKTPEKLALGGFYLLAELLFPFSITKLVKFFQPGMPVFESVFFRNLYCLPFLLLYGRCLLVQVFLC